MLISELKTKRKIIYPISRKLTAVSSQSTLNPSKYMLFNDSINSLIDTYKRLPIESYQFNKIIVPEIERTFFPSKSINYSVIAQELNKQLIPSTDLSMASRLPVKDKPNIYTMHHLIENWILRSKILPNIDRKVAFFDNFLTTVYETNFRNNEIDDIYTFIPLELLKNKFKTLTDGNSLLSMFYLIDKKKIKSFKNTKFLKNLIIYSKNYYFVKSDGINLDTYYRYISEATTNSQDTHITTHGDNGYLYGYRNKNEKDSIIMYRNSEDMIASVVDNKLNYEDLYFYRISTTDKNLIGDGVHKGDNDTVTIDNFKPPKVATLNYNTSSNQVTIEFDKSDSITVSINTLDDDDYEELLNLLLKDNNLNNYIFTKNKHLLNDLREALRNTHLQGIPHKSIKELYNKIKNKLIDDNTELLDKLASEKKDELTNLENIKKRSRLETKVVTTVKSIGKEEYEPVEIKSDLIEDSMKQSYGAGFRKSYNNDNLKQDIKSMMHGLGKSENLPIYVHNIEIEDNDDTYNKMFKVKLKLRDEKGLNTTIVQNIPKISKDGTLFLNNNRLIIENQVASLPITKVLVRKEVTVRYTTGYTRVFLNLTNQGTLTPLVRKGLNFLSKQISDDDAKTITTGNSVAAVGNTITSLEFNEYAKKIIRITKSGYTILFNPKITKELTYELVFSRDNENLLVIGESSKNLVVLSDNGNIFIVKKGTDDVLITYETLTEFIGTLYGVDIKSMDYPKASYRYTFMSIAGAPIPLVIMLSYLYGLETVMKLYDIEYSFSKVDLKNNKSRIEFNNGYLYFEDNLKFNMLLNGLISTDTKVYDFDDYVKKGSVYINYFNQKLGKGAFGVIIENFSELFIDSTTKEVLEFYELPSTFLESFLYCNTLLTSPNFMEKNNNRLYRVRNNEIIATHLYRIVGKYINLYKKEKLSGNNSITLNVPHNETLNNVMGEPVVKDYPLLNPIREIDGNALTTYKGVGGEAISSSKGTETLRVFDKSSIGIYGTSTPPNSSAGLTRKLSDGTMMRHKRGYIPETDPKKLPPNAYFSASENLQTFVMTRDDPPRQAMAVTQNGHQLVTNQMNTALVSTGTHKKAPYLTTDEFATKAIDDGKVVSIDKDKELMTVKYKNGITSVIDITNKIQRTQDGFYVSVKKVPIVEVGKTFKKGDIIAIDEKFFKVDGNNSELYSGTLCKLALTTADFTYEDSSYISENLANKLSSNLIMRTTVKMNKYAVIHTLKKKGDVVKASDDLAVFEEVKDVDDESFNNLLARLDDNLGNELSSLGVMKKSAPYTGEILDVRIYYNNPIEEYDPSVQKILNKYISQNKKRNKYIDENNEEDGNFINYRDIESNKTGRVGSDMFDGLMIEFFINTVDKFKFGDKLSMSPTALKNIVADILPDDESGYSEYDDKPIDMYLSPMSFISRQTPSLFFIMYLNKGLIGLKEQVREILKD